jgi:hypothetical protein
MYKEKAGIYIRVIKIQDKTVFSEIFSCRKTVIIESLHFHCSALAQHSANPHYKTNEELKQA